MANLIDGKAIAAKIRERVGEKVVSLKTKDPAGPKLVVVLVGERRDSQTYVGMKEKACAECGIASEVIRVPADITEEDLLAQVRKLNADDTVHGILVQLPLPDHIQESRVVDCINYRKDVDGLHPMTVGHLALKGRTPRAKPCTAEGCVELCRSYKVNMKGAEVVVVGRSNIVGMPVALLFQQEDATVTMCHSRTANLAEVCRRADIIIAAIGKPNFVKGDWIKEGCVVIDVGINSVDDSSTPKGYKLVGDADFKECEKKAKLITPVPGGVGPMTVAILMRNTVDSYEQLMNDKQLNKGA
eukprot:GHVN01029810.1.p1 GENE.GHVN01029810.1~~GHVN01029810.1.p1  ORF type:complete len:300 (-),score=49.44 GHVN01029810.1:83-982(-)